MRRLLLVIPCLVLSAGPITDRFEYEPQTSVKAMFMVGDSGDLCLSYSAKGVMTIYTGCQVGLRKISKVVVKTLKDSNNGR